MPKKQEAHPNLNQGGNEGNVFGAGNKRRSLRKKLLDGADTTAEYWLQVARGNKVIVVPGFGNKPDGTRKPTHEERGKAFETLLRYGLGTQDEILMVGDDKVFEALGAILPEFVAADQVAPFLSRLKSVLGDES